MSIAAQVHSCSRDITIATMDNALSHWPLAITAWSCVCQSPCGIWYTFYGWRGHQRQLMHTWP
jgi:hypothetical protein